MDGYAAFITISVVGGLISLLFFAAKYGVNMTKDSTVVNPQIKRFSIKELIDDVKDTAKRNAEYTARINNMSLNEQLEELRRLRNARLGVVEKQKKQPERTLREQRMENWGKPIYEHTTEDCSGGSIHDGYHEGTVRRPAPASSAEGRIGSQGVERGKSPAAAAAEAKRRELENKKRDPHSIVVKTDDEAVEKPELGAEKLKKAIADKPAIVQGLIWSEVLSRPLSDG